jgi:ethanolamine utilization protein EutA
MHELGAGGHDHSNVALESFLSKLDNVQLTTVGVDVGSSTFHLMFARVHLQRETLNLSTRYEIVEREVLWRSEIGQTPYSGHRIDADKIGKFVAQCYQDAGFAPEEIDSGAVILTGEALRQYNARAIAEGIAAGSGKFVCVSAGHHLEAMLAAYGSGATEYTKQNDARLLHVDIGGGTTKLSLIEGGEVRATAAVMVGGRQVAWNDHREIISTTAGARTIARSVGIDTSTGSYFTQDDEERFVNAQAEVIFSIVNKDSLELGRRLRLTKVLPKGFIPTAVSFSGGVSEYIYGREAGEFGDLGPSLGRVLGAGIEARRFILPVVDPGVGIRATVVGASQSSVRLSGNTVEISDVDILPLHNVPVIHPVVRRWTEADPLESDELELAIKEAVALHGLNMDIAIAIALPWHGDPSHRRMADLVRGVQQAFNQASSSPVIVLMDDDIGASIGRLLMTEFPLKRPLICLDGLDLMPLDHVDVGTVLEPSGAVPVVIKSLLFGADK